MKTIITVALLGVSLLACSKKDDKPKGDNADKGGKPDKGGGDGKATLDDIKALDCDKACAAMVDCNTKIAEKFKTPAPPADAKDSCMTGCQTLKSGAGSEEVKLMAGQAYLEFAKGKCDL